MVDEIVGWIGLGPHRFLEDAPSAVIVARDDGHIAWANRAAVTLFGYARQEFVGKPVDFLVPLDRRTNHAAHIAGWIKHPRARPMGADLHIQGANKNGDLMDLDIQLSPIETDNGIMALAWIRPRSGGPIP